MADIKLGSDCDDDCGDDDRGERGKRGKRGHTGPAGPPGPAGSLAGGLLKFSGSAAFTVGAIVSSFLADFGTGLGTALGAAPNYPVAIVRSFRNMATNFTATGLSPSPASILTVELLQNGVPVPGFVITYGPGEGGIKTVAAGPVSYAIGDTFDVRVTTENFVSGTTINVSATIGTEA